ncbi:pilus assembly protein PilP [Psychromonas aquatilis]|uniref:Pilus assembly protein PilP n=1 Tax=Psychromonas aquatilis TaxID=2005072 RepID=A0ABU9GM31_9GAMM
MKLKCIMVLSCCLFSCVDPQLQELRQYVSETKQKDYLFDEAVPSASKTQLVDFTENKIRDPFSQPSKAVITTVTNTNAPTIDSCISADFPEQNRALEKATIEAIEMRGTIMLDQELWALVKTIDSNIYRVKLGSYLGLNNAKVIKVNHDNIEVLEYISDLNGCSKERISQINLVAK